MAFLVWKTMLYSWEEKTSIIIIEQKQGIPLEWKDMLLLFFMEWTKENCYFLRDEYHQITQWCLEVTHTSYWRS